MRQFFEIALCILVVFMGGVAQADQQWQINLKKSNVGFLLHSTLHEVNGQARELSGGFEQQLNSIKGLVDVGVAGLTTDNKARDNNMYQMFDLSRYANIRFTFDNTDIANVLNHQDGDIIFSGTMTIHNISHPVTLLSKGHMDQNSLVCQGRMLIHLKDYGLKPPSVLGIIRVRDEVIVQYTIVFVTKPKTYDNS